MKKKIDLVTGASGFIGRYFAERLIQNGSSVRVLCRPGSKSKLSRKITESAEIAFGDLRDRDSLLEATQGVRRIFHCAGQVSDWGPLKDFQAMNVQGTRWLLESASQVKIERFIHLSSIAVFGTPAPSYFDDDSPYGHSNDCYSLSKVEGEKLVFSFFKKNKIPITVLRPAVVYGVGGTWLEEPIRMIKKNQMFLLGGGKGTCHPCYIENLLDAMVLVGEHPDAIGRAYIVTDGTSVTFREYFNSLARIVGKPKIGRNVPLPVARTIASACEAAAQLQRSENRPLLTHTAINMVATVSQTSTMRIQKELGFNQRYSFSAALEDLEKKFKIKSN